MIDVAFTRAELRPGDIAVVIDVLRATSTITTALAAGYRRVLCADSIERALTLRGSHRTLAGERGCVLPDGFDLGNSPLEAARRYTEELVVATTNGAPAIVAASATSQTVMLACLLNLDAVLHELGAVAEHATIQIVCSGTDGRPAVEDVYVAGRICAGLRGTRTDGALIAEGVARAYPSAFRALAASSNAAVLRATGSDDDIACCSRISVLDTVPVVVSANDGVATVIDGRGTVSTMPRSRPTHSQPSVRELIPQSAL